MSVRTGAWCRPGEWRARRWWHLCWRMLFCKNLEEIRWRRCGGISRAMADKSTSSKGASVTDETTAVAPRGRIYPIVKYGDPVLEKPAATITKFDSDLGQLV